MNVQEIKQKYFNDFVKYGKGSTAREEGFERVDTFLKNGVKYVRGYYKGKLVEKKVYGKGDKEKIKLGGVEYFL